MSAVTGCDLDGRTVCENSRSKFIDFSYFFPSKRISCYLTMTATNCMSCSSNQLLMKYVTFLISRKIKSSVSGTNTLMVKKWNGNNKIS